MNLKKYFKTQILYHIHNKKYQLLPYKIKKISF